MDATLTGRKPRLWQSGLSLWGLLAGGIAGFLFLLVMLLKLKWIIFLFLATLVLLASLAATNKKDYFLVLLVLALPVGIDINFFYRPSPFGISTFGFPIHVSFLPLSVLYLIWTLRRLQGQEPASLATRGLLPLVGVFGAATISVLGSQDQLFAAFDLFALGTSMLIFIYTASEIRQRRQFNLVLGVLIFGAACQGVFALAQYLTGSSLGLEFFGAAKLLYGYTGKAVVSRVGGLIGHPNNLALFFDLTLPLSFSLLFCPLSGRARFFLAVAIFLQVAGLGVTFSRGGILGSGLGVLSLSVFHGIRRFGLVRGLCLTMMGALVLALFLTIVPNPIQKSLSRTEATAHGRWPLSGIALTMISHHPLFGVGLNNYTHTSRSYDFTREQIVSAWNSPVHNLFLFIAGEIGLVGLLCFVIFLAQALTGLIPAMRSPDPFILSVAGGLFFGLIAFLIQAQVDYSIWTQNRPLWFFLGLAMGVGRFAGMAATPSPHGLR
jgi:putative inorganic carbon (hco3(-)) transporter